MRHAIVHVGPHKTGSTYLQHCLRYNAGALAARGVVVPARWEQSPDNPSHAGLVRALDHPAGFEEARTALDRELRPAGGTLVISAEDLASPVPERLNRLRELLRGLTVTIVFYVRRWSDLLPSSWQETIKQGQDAPLESFYLAHVRNPHASQIFNLDLRLRPFRDIFGPDALKLVCYTILRERKIDLFTHFAAQFLAWPNPALPPGERELNASRSEPYIELLRLLNDLEFQSSGQRSSALRNRLDAMAPELNLARVLDWLEDRGTATLCSDGFPDLQTLHERLHADHQASIVPPASPRLFFTPARRELRFIKDNSMCRPEIAAEVHRIFDAVRSRL